MKLKCQDCGLEKDDVKETICPFAADVNGTTVPIVVCGDCYKERLYDI